MQEKNDQLRESLEREVKAKLSALTDMQRELAKGEVARVKVEQLETERKDLRESLEQAKRWVTYLKYLKILKMSL